MIADEQDGTVYTAVINHEEQYSIWPVDRDLPAGWNRSGTPGSRDAVLAYITKVWTDMRPLSLRQSRPAGHGADADEG
jgi:MbtH protein